MLGSDSFCKKYAGGTLNCRHSVQIIQEKRSSLQDGFIASAYRDLVMGVEISGNFMWWQTILKNGIQVFLIKHCPRWDMPHYQKENALTPLNSRANVLFFGVIRYWVVDVSHVSLNSHRYSFWTDSSCRMKKIDNLVAENHSRVLIRKLQ